MEDKTAVGLVMVPFRGMGHLVPMVELARRLLQLPSPNYRFSITILHIRTEHPPPQVTTFISAVSSTVPDISIIDLPVVGLPRLPGNPTVVTVLYAVVDILKPLIKSAIETLIAKSPSVPVAAIVVDFFCTAVIDVARELDIPPYIFYAGDAGNVGLTMYLRTLDATLPPNKETEELQEDGVKLDVPGFSKPLPPISLPGPVFQRKEFDSPYVRNHYRFREAKGILINTFAELQPDIIKSLKEGLYIPGHLMPPVYPIGPIISLKPISAGAEEHECIKWLNGQPPCSVVFLCFGSFRGFSADEAKEMAKGLERSGHRFLWVLRSPPPPNEEQTTKVPTRQPIDADLEEMLPEGFLDRVKGRGMVWPTFAPQVEILSHEAVGGFVTHCGWNSSLEGLWFGVPMAAWPRYAEQHFNAWEMSEEMGVAVALKIDRKGGNWVSAEELERGVRLLMEEDGSGEGWKLRKRVLEMKGKSRKAVEEGGSSYLSLARWVAEIRDHVGSK